MLKHYLTRVQAHLNNKHKHIYKKYTGKPGHDDGKVIQVDLHG